MVSGDAARNQESAGALIAERYAVEHQLGRGGMATVFSARDLTTGKQIALKRLVSGHAPDSLVARLFEREFWTLSELVHPRIIEVYDYHTDELGPFYTMELLSGGDLRHRAPLAWLDVCRLLCDVCSALALLHSRRLLHRDLTPLNIRSTQDDRAKLFDFGSMAPFGRSQHIVGTPPFVAPEALNGQTLDGQTDLFALGATAYFALTGKHAFPARVLADLPDLWRRQPPPPSQLVPGIPPELDELVMSLMQLAAADRCATAAELMERLSAIGGFAIDEALVVRQAYVSTPTLVGRSEPLERVKKQTQRAIAGRGAVVVITGAEGTGRSRLLDACALQGKLLGALVLSVSAQTAGDRPWGGTAALLSQLRMQAPELFTGVFEPRAQALAAVLPELGSAANDVSAEPTHAARAKIQQSLLEGWLAIGSQRPVLLAIDDLHRIDEPSVALIALLVHEVQATRLTVLATIQPDAGSSAAAKALALITEAADTIRLRDLAPDDTQALVSSVFGEVPNVRLLGERIVAATSGNPGLVMQLLQQLVHSGRARYAAGQWSLPSKLDKDELAAALQRGLDPELGEDARDLARVIALAGAGRRSYDECLQLCGHADDKRLLRDLRALCASDVLAMDDDGYRISRPGWEPLLLQDMTGAQRCELHARVARFFSDRPADHFRFVQHLARSGQSLRAIEVLLTNLNNERSDRLRDPAVLFAYLDALPPDWPQTFHELIAAAAELGRPRLERLTLQIDLLAFATMTARHERALLFELAAQLRCDVGLDLYDELSHDMPAGERLQRALTEAQQRYERTPEHDRGYPLLEALHMLARLLVQGIGMAGRSLDYGLLAALPSIAPLTALSPALAVIHQNVQSTLHILAGRIPQARAGYAEILERLEQPDGAGLGATEVALVSAAIVYALISIDAQAGRPTALARLDVLQASPLYAVSALRLRATYALFQGDRAQAEVLHERMELAQIQNRPPQIFEGTQSMQLMFGYTAISDLLRVKQCMTDIEAMAQELDPWKPLVHCARGAYQSLRGDHSVAASELESALGQITAGRHTAWTWTASMYLWALVHARRPQEAIDASRGLLQQAERAQMSELKYALQLPMADAHSLLGHHDEARAIAAAALESQQTVGGIGVPLAAAHETCAWIALRAGDAVSFNEHASVCEAQYRVGNYGPLLARHDKLMRAARKAGLIAPLVEYDSASMHPDDLSSTSTVLSRAQGPAQRAEQALAMLLERCGAKAGCLYVLQRSGPVLAAQQGQMPLPHELDDLVASFVADALTVDDVTRTQPGESLVVSASAWTVGDTAEARFVPMLLSHPTPEGRCVTGVAVTWVARDAGFTLPTRLLQALSSALRDRGDAVTHIIGTAGGDDDS